MDRVPGVSPIAVHSASSWHLRRHQSGKFRVTSTPDGFAIMRGRLVRPEPFLVHHRGLDDDGFCLCQKCHIEVHDIALAITKATLPWHTGRNSSPYILENVTIAFIESGGVWTY